MTICIAGEVPPPIGGISIHVQRLIHSLKREDVDVEFARLRYREAGLKGILLYIKSIKKILSRSTGNLIHYQMNNWIEGTLIYMLLCIVRKSMIYTVHSFRYEEFSLAKRICMQLCTRTKIRFIAPGPEVKNDMCNKGFIERNIYIHDTYLDPTSDERNSSIPSVIDRFVKSNKEQKVVLGNAYKLVLTKDGIDLYGLDMCIELIERNEDLCLLFYLGQIGDIDYYNQCLRHINEAGLSHRILIYTGGTSLIPAFRIADVFVRPTLTDSFGISVAEAISCKIPAVASNVCNRAEGAILFESRDSESFSSAVRMAMNNEAIEVSNRNCNWYVDLYKELSD